MTGCFYLPLGDGMWRATEHTSGPWDTSAQHGGPPSALLGRAMQRCAPRDDMIIARVTCEILGPVPVGELRVRARVARPGRGVELLEAAASAGGRDVATARAWRVRRADTGRAPLPPARSAPAGADQARADQAGAGLGPGPGRTGAGQGTPGPAGNARRSDTTGPGVAVAVPPWSRPVPPDVPVDGSGGGTPEAWGGGYLSAVEWRVARGGFTMPGPTAVWARLRYPLVAGEETSPLERVLAIADSGSGASGQLDFATWYFINPELTVHLHREAAGEWICLDASTTISAGGAGLATSVISDLAGPVGTGAQSLLVRPR